MNHAERLLNGPWKAFAVRQGVKYLHKEKLLGKRFQATADELVSKLGKEIWSSRDWKDAEVIYRWHMGEVSNGIRNNQREGS